MRSTVILLIAATALLVLGLWTTAAPLSPSTHELSDRFDADMRQVVIEWDPADARPDAVRRKALFEFVYQTYDATAWIPQSLFDRNVFMQVVAGDVNTIVGEKVGLVLWRDNPHCAGVRHGAQRAAHRRDGRSATSPQVDGELPRLPHGGDRRRRLSRRRHQDIRR